MNTEHNSVSSVITDNTVSKKTRQLEKRKLHVTCIVPNCNTKSMKSELHFFKFPKNKEYAQKWIDSIGLLRNDIINKHNYVCQRHFLVRKIILNSPFKNCMTDESQAIELDWNSFKTDFEMSLKSHESTSINSLPPDNIIEEADIHIIKENALVYYTGYCIMKKIDCQSCREKMIKKGDEINISDTFLAEKNFKIKDSNFGSLSAPSDEFATIARSLVKVFEKYYHQNCCYHNIIKFLTDECLKMMAEEYTSFLPNPDEACYDHIRKLVHFFNLVLMRKNCRWSTVNNEFSKTKQATRKLKILKS